MEIDSYFGEFGGFNGSYNIRRWAVIAKKKTVVYAVPLKILMNRVLVDEEVRGCFEEET